MTKIVIVGCGYVGTGMKKIFPEAIDIDPPRGIGARNDAIDADLAVVCVPTPPRANDGGCDTSVVTETLSDLAARRVKLALVKSTVPPGTCERLSREFRLPIVFSPEYMGESKYYTPPQFPDPRNPVSHGFVILGGDQQSCSYIADILLPRLGPATRFRFMTATEAEIVKYSENTFFSLKVTFSNLMRSICEAHGVNYHTVREGWLDDPRIGPMFSAAFHDSRGFSGKCLPKDTSALAVHCRGIGVNPALLEAILSANRGME